MYSSSSRSKSQFCKCCPSLFPRPPCSPSQRCKVYTQKGVMPATPPLSSHTLAQDSQAADGLTSDSTHLSQTLLGLEILLKVMRMHETSGILLFSQKCSVSATSNVFIMSSHPATFINLLILPRRSCYSRVHVIFLSQKYSLCRA